MAEAGRHDEEEEVEEVEEVEEEEEEEEVEDEDEELEPPEIPDLQIDDPPEGGVDTTYLGHVAKKRRLVEGRSIYNEGNSFVFVM